MPDLESSLPHDTVVIRLKVDRFALPGYIVVVLDPDGRWYERAIFGLKLEVLRNTTVWKDVHRINEHSDITPENKGMTYWGNSKDDIIYDLAPIYKSTFLNLWVSVNDVELG